MFDVTLNNGVKMPVLGYGTYKITGEIDVQACVLDALAIGYRSIDTATFYNNQSGIGEALKKSKIARNELFLTSKLWTNVKTADDAVKITENTLAELGTDYLDLLLIHWPTSSSPEVWKGMERLVKEHKVRAIGLSNFKEHHIDDILKICSIAPAVDQVEFHPLFQQPELRAYCQKLGIQVEAWSPLMRGNILDNIALNALAEKYNKSVSQIVLRYDIQSNVAVIPKSTKKERMAENFDVFDFVLSDADVDIIKNMDCGARQYRDPDCHGY